MSFKSSPLAIYSQLLVVGKIIIIIISLFLTRDFDAEVVNKERFSNESAKIVFFFFIILQWIDCVNKVLKGIWPISAFFKAWWSFSHRPTTHCVETNEKICTNNFFYIYIFYVFYMVGHFNVLFRRFSATIVCKL